VVLLKDSFCRTAPIWIPGDNSPAKEMPHTAGIAACKSAPHSGQAATKAAQIGEVRGFSPKTKRCIATIANAGKIFFALVAGLELSEETVVRQFHGVWTRIILVFAVAGIPASAFAQSCVSFANGSFETGGTQNTSLAAGSTALSPWQVLADGVDWISSANSVSATQGTNFIDLSGPNGQGGIRQAVCTTAWRLYMLTFDFNAHPNGGNGSPETVVVTAGDQTAVYTTDPGTSLSPPWRRNMSMVFTALTNATAITLQSGGFDTTGPLIDNVRLVEVQLAGCIPEFSFAVGGAPAAVSSGLLNLNLNPSCGWTATTNVSWINLQQTSGTGPGVVNYNISANGSPNSRTGAIFVNGRRHVVTQAGTECNYSVSPGSKSAPATLDLGIIGVGAPPGCTWTATTDSSWIDLSANENVQSDGSGFVVFTIAENPSPQRRTGSIFVAGQLYTVTQAGTGPTYACQTAGSSLNFVRQEGLTEGLEDLRISCTGTVPPGGATGDILVTYDATITSKMIGPGADDVDIWLILNNATNPVVGTTAFRGKLAGPSSVRFTNVPLTNVVGGVAEFRIVNARVSGSSVRAFTGIVSIVAGIVQIRSTKFIPVSGDFTIIGVAGPGSQVTTGAVSPVNGGTHQLLPVTFSERQNAHFRPKDRPAGSTIEFRSEAESLFKHANLGAQSGVADTGTRLRLRIPVPAGVRVWAPTTLLGTVDARLVSANESGSGGSVIPGSAMFGGTYQELTAVNNFATAVWEVMAADAELRESATANLVFQGTGDLTAISRGLVPTLAPISTKGTPDGTSAIPRFLDPLGTPRIVNLRVTPTIQSLGTSASGKSGIRQIVGSNFRFSYEVANEGTDQATNVVVRGNLPPGFNYTSCTRTDGGACTASGTEARAAIADLDGGESVTISVNASQINEIPDGTVLENSVSVSSDQIDADLQSNQATTPFLIDNCNVTLSSSSASISGAGGAGTFSFGNCSYWVVKPDVAWITITSTQSGTGAGSVSFAVAQNPTASPRTGSIIAAGRTFTVNQAAGDGCTYSLSTNSATSGLVGVKTTVRLNVTGTNCSWSASSPASWVQVFPLNGTATTNVEYNIFPNFSNVARSTVLNIGGQAFTVQQAAGLADINQRIVQLAYFNFLGRLPSSSELASQTAVLTSGTNRSAFLLSFFNQEEFNQGGRFVAGLYVGLLNRDAEYSGWLFQRSALATGVVTQDQLVSNFINSQEFNLKFGTLSNTAFVELMFRNILLREPAQHELNAWVDVFSNPNNTRTMVARTFLNSSEFRNGTGPRLTAFLLYSTILQREATAGERNGLIQQINAGTPILNLISTFVNSSEFSSVIGQ
jgi:uncharacterized repeat protein (TIGR01451 family)